MLENAMLKEIAAKDGDALCQARGCRAPMLRVRGERRRACSVLGTDARRFRYRSTRPDDAAIRTRLGELASGERRRACSVLGTDARRFRYRSTRPDDAAIRTRLGELASQGRRFGYRLHILLTRE